MGAPRSVSYTTRLLPTASSTLCFKVLIIRTFLSAIDTVQYRKPYWVVLFSKFVVSDVCTVVVLAQLFLVLAGCWLAVVSSVPAHQFSAVAGGSGQGKRSRVLRTQG